LRYPSPYRISRRFSERTVVDMTQLFGSIASICFATQAALKKNISGILRKKMGHEPAGPVPKPPDF
jgi:hypothetical protein